jgi:hypothetical protein
MFLRMITKHTFLHFMASNLFYDMQSKFQNKVLLLKMCMKYIV